MDESETGATPHGLSYYTQGDPISSLV